ncbi:MAG: ribonuclease HII [Candidatus Saccharimonadales bacterium]
MVIGIDEVGRGSLAGPLVIGAVSLDIRLKGLKDSKLLTAAQRNVMATEIYALSELASLGWCWPEEIDSLGLTKATTLAISRALLDVDTSKADIIIDGNFNYLPHITTARSLIKADNLIPSVSAASIIAKVARDNYMRSIAQYFPGYGFELHVGYGTKYHLSRLASLGPCAIHRLSFKVK